MSRFTVFQENIQFFHIQNSSYSQHILKGIVLSKVIQILRNTSSLGYFRMIKMALIKFFHAKKFAVTAINAAK